MSCGNLRALGRSACRRREASLLTRVQLFDLKQIFGGGAKPSEQKKLGEPVAYGSGGVWGSGVPSMDDLWREAWPVQACQDMMKMREDMNT